jgi:nitrite reductase/ring-hydroxylating ferredoxin subunit
MELPDCVIELGEQIKRGDSITPDPDLFEAYEVFSAEVANIFTKPWLAVDHVSRLAVDGDFFRADVGPRSVVIVRETENQIHALRNTCLHAGYRVCEEESGRGTQLFCQYHGWYYALDGRLTEPVLRPDIKDRSRYRLPRYAMQIARGLILLDPSAVAPEPPPAGPVDLGAIPEDLGERSIARRQRHKTTLNWKQLQQYLLNRPELVFAGAGCDNVIELGALSFVAIHGDDVALVRLIPRYPGQTELDVVELPVSGTASQNGAADTLADTLRDDSDAIADAPLARSFYDWYWARMEPPETVN